MPINDEAEGQFWHVTAGSAHFRALAVLLLPSPQQPSTFLPQLLQTYNTRDRMNCESASSAGRKSSYDALTSLLGVEGALRLLPQGSTPKAHIVLKRDYPKGEGKSDQAPTVARFSFIAGKKFTINKGQPLLFAVACPTDRDGKTLLGDDNTFVLEADIKGNSEDTSLEDTGRLPEQEDSKRSENIECLPPKARKSLGRKKAYASYIESSFQVIFFSTIF
jgi:hypothetical protein